MVAVFKFKDSTDSASFPRGVLVQHCFATGRQSCCKVEEQRHLAAKQEIRQSYEQSDITPI